eukprot:m.183995 g.183995  ORF g.183995 m.183995 type:complete len:122 (-) comp14708_c0_seq2:98-463(-)
MAFFAVGRRVFGLCLDPQASTVSFLQTLFVRLICKHNVLYPIIFCFCACFCAAACCLLIGCSVGWTCYVLFAVLAVAFLSVCSYNIMLQNDTSLNCLVWLLISDELQWLLSPSHPTPTLLF